MRPEEERWVLLADAIHVLGLRLLEGPPTDSGLSLCASDRWNTWGRTGLGAEEEGSCLTAIILVEHPSGYLGKLITDPSQERLGNQI